MTDCNQGRHVKRAANAGPATGDVALSAQGTTVVIERGDADKSGQLLVTDRAEFGQRIVYRDVDSTGTGKWRETIAAKLARSAACVAVIGPRWVEPDHLKRLQA